MLMLPTYLHQLPVPQKLCTITLIIVGYHFFFIRCYFFVVFGILRKMYNNLLEKREYLICIIDRKSITIHLRQKNVALALKETNTLDLNVR